MVVANYLNVDVRDVKEDGIVALSIDIAIWNDDPDYIDVLNVSINVYSIVLHHPAMGEKDVDVLLENCSTVI